MSVKGEFGCRRLGSSGSFSGFLSAFAREINGNISHLFRIPEKGNEERWRANKRVGDKSGKETFQQNPDCIMSPKTSHNKLYFCFDQETWRRRRPADRKWASLSPCAVHVHELVWSPSLNPAIREMSLGGPQGRSPAPRTTTVSQPPPPRPPPGGEAPPPPTPH